MTSKNLNKVKRLRWTMRQKSRLVKMLGIPLAVSIECPFCRNRVNEGDFFCCSELQDMWAMTESTNVAPVLEENLS